MKQHVLPGAFSIPTQVVFAPGVSRKAGPIARGMGATRVFAVTDPGVAKAGVLEPALASIRDAGLALALYDRAPLDPTLADAAQVAAEATAFGADLVVAAGGGSGLCSGRSAAVAMTNGDLHSCTGHDKYAHDPVPVIAIPTTAGSGSEVSKHVTLSDERTGRKTGIDGYTNAPKVALLDPDLVQGVPRQVAIASGIDAFLHALEAYLSTRATALTDAIALDAFARIWTLLPRALAGDAQAKGDMLFASSMANVACGNAGLTLVHAMNGGVTYCFKARGHEPVAYGMIHGALMPPILRFFVPAARDRLARLAPIVGTPAGDAEAVVERIVAWARECGAPRSLPWGRIPDADIDLIIDETLERQRPSPRQPSRDEARGIVLEALGVA
ncbi:MAG: iron-containing alcohol dehydrogenase [Chloroflexota bacterium]|nr:iron-containing alcohol dehydrogenase [Chloroflexota bacterium]MDE3101445.1 iron-containing alcohol dehydrogenase [Chloroflexota bacterium]